MASQNDPMTVEGIDAYIDRHLRLAPGTKTQYGHPSPRFWSDWDAPLEELFAPYDPSKLQALYLHIPFCPPTDPPACGFCLFARQDHTSNGLIVQYVDHLLVELDRVGRRIGGVELDCVYFGGGTPNLLRAPEIRRIFARIRDYFAVTPSTEVTFEGYPGLFTADRMEALVEEGTTRISIGVQQLKDELLRHSGRRSQPEQVEETVRFCREHGLRCSVDLISGWFDQTTQDVIDDIDQLTEWGVTGIVNHPLTLAGDSPFARRADELPDNAAMCETFLAARAHLLELGYRADSYTDYALESVPVVRYLELYRRILDTERVGVGYGANSVIAGAPDAPGHTYVNVTGTENYRARVDAGSSCVARGFRFSADDLRLLYVLKGLEGAPYLDPRDYAERFGRDLREDFAPCWEALEARRWLSWTEERVSLAGDAIFYTAMVQRCLSEPRNRELRARVHAHAC